MTLDNKVALITGGSRGIGRGIAEALLKEGAKVVITGRSPEKGQQALQEMAAGENAHFISGDVRLQAEVERSVDEGIERHSGKLISW